MSIPRHRSYIIAPVNSLREMIEAEQRVAVRCDKCKVRRELSMADLQSLADKVGADYSLVDRRCRCRLTEGCNGWNTFDYLRGVFRPLATTDGINRWLFGR